MWFFKWCIVFYILGFFRKLGEFGVGLGCVVVVIGMCVCFRYYGVRFVEVFLKGFEVFV